MKKPMKPPEKKIDLTNKTPPKCATRPVRLIFTDRPCCLKSLKERDPKIQGTGLALQNNQDFEIAFWAMALRKPCADALVPKIPGALAAPAVQGGEG